MGGTDVNVMLDTFLRFKALAKSSLSKESFSPRIPALAMPLSSAITKSPGESTFVLSSAAYTFTDNIENPTLDNAKKSSVKTDTVINRNLNPNLFFICKTSVNPFFYSQ